MSAMALERSVLAAVETATTGMDGAAACAAVVSLARLEQAAMILMASAAIATSEAFEVMESFHRRQSSQRSNFVIQLRAATQVLVLSRCRGDLSGRLIQLRLIQFNDAA